MHVIQPPMGTTGPGASDIHIPSLYRYNTLGSLSWGLETRETWGLFRGGKLCEKCRQQGVGATSPVNIMAPPVRHKGKIVDYLGWDWVYVSTLSKIRSAGFGACAFCMLLYLGFRRLERAQYDPDLEPSGYWDFRYAFPNPRCLRVSALHPADGDGEVVEQFYITLENDPGPDEGKPAIIQSDWASFMRSRLDACLINDGHDACRRDPGFKVEWPRRMLKITPSTATLLDFDERMAGEYAALSYCWGSEDELKQNPPLKATTSTHSQLKSGIPLSDLPLTIKEALSVCSSLGIEYIWIDALCIVQDDAGDWEAEARKMATVYSMAKVTIIAASSTSCHSGFLQGLSRGGELLALPPELPPMRLVARRTSTSGFHFNVADFANFDPASVDTPAEPQDAIDSRGWTFQEESLSSRYIKFTKDDIQWQCREDAGCLCHQGVQKHERRALYEDLWASSPPAGSSSNPPHSQGSNSRRRPTSNSSPADQSFNHASRACWQEIVKDFSRRRFTQPTDKLLALSGLAGRVAANMQSPHADDGSAYVAGMWTNMLRDGGALSWHCRHESPRGRAPSLGRYIAPSFSWASLTGDCAGVVYDQGSVGPLGFQGEQRLFDVVTAERTLLSADEEFGRVSAASVTLSGPLVPCTVRYGPHSCPEVVEVGGSEFSVASRRRTWFASRRRTWFDCGVSRTTLPSGEVALQRCRDNLPFKATRTHILLLRSMEFYSFGSGFEGLVLGRVGGDGADGYQRLGYVRIRGAGGGRKLDVDKFHAVVTIY